MGATHSHQPVVSCNETEGRGRQRHWAEDRQMRSLSPVKVHHDQQPAPTSHSSFPVASLGLPLLGEDQGTVSEGAAQRGRQMQVAGRWACPRPQPGLEPVASQPGECSSWALLCGSWWVWLGPKVFIRLGLPLPIPRDPNVNLDPK